MDNYRPVMSFDEATAADYDAMAQRGDEEATVAFLERWARGGRALELAIGTGRIALPLTARGVAVDGIDLSPAMVDQLRRKPGGAALDVVVGDFSKDAPPGPYRLVYLVFNTLFNLLTQDDQVRCFQHVAERLEPGGAFVVEGGVPAEFYRLRNHQYVDAEAIQTDRVRLDIARFDPVTQRLEETHVTLSETGLRLNPIVTRYAWPAELDLMARLAGLRRAERWGGWSGEPFTASSDNGVSVYVKEPA